MKYFFIAISLFFILSGCGEDGEDGVPTLTGDGDPGIVALDLSGIGSNESYYYAGRAYPVSGPGYVYWTDGGTWWSAYLPIEPGTQGEDPPLFGLLMMDGDDGTAKGYYMYFGLGTYSFYNATISVNAQTSNAQEILNPNIPNHLQLKPFELR